MAVADENDFEQESAAASDDARFILDLDGYEGPIDVLLTLARDQKVDLTKISILELADQYLSFVARARHLRLELAADYLVMAAWLAYLKSRLLLPEPEGEGEPSATELAAALAFQLQRLEAMRETARKLMALPRLGQDIFARGAPEGIEVIRRPVIRIDLYELLRAYGRIAGRKPAAPLRILPPELYSMDDALKRLGEIIGQRLDWCMLSEFLPVMSSNPLVRRSAVASTFAASLELVKSGRAELRQESSFGPIYLRRATGAS